MTKNGKRRPRHTASLAVRLTESERALLIGAADRERLMVSTWARRVLVDAARQEPLRFGSEAVAPTAAP